MFKKLLLTILLSVGLSLTIPVRADYCYNTGTHGRSGAYVSSLTVTGGESDFALSGHSTSNGRAVYQDMTASNILVAQPGSTLTLTSNWTGTAMHGYLYVDYNKDETFGDATTTTYGGDLFNVADTGIPASGSELVSYTCYTGTLTGNQCHNSAGDTFDWNIAGSSSIAGSIAFPSFTIPSDLAAGDYRIRYKIDWNQLEPCGTENTKFAGSDGGEIIDFTLRIERNDPVYTAINLSSGFPVQVPTEYSTQIVANNAVTIAIDYTLNSATDEQAFVSFENDTTGMAYTSNDTDKYCWRTGVTVGGNKYTLWTSPSSTLGENVHLVITISNTTLTAYSTKYSDDLSSAMQSQASNLTTNSVSIYSSIYIGGINISTSAPGTCLFGGTINSIRFYDEALSSTEVASLDWDNLTPTVVPTIYYGITVEQPAEHGTFTLTDGTNDYTTGTHNILETTSLTVVPTPATGYEFDQLLVNGEAQASTSFTVTENATVTVTFKEKEYCVTSQTHTNSEKQFYFKSISVTGTDAGDFSFSSGQTSDNGIYQDFTASVLTAYAGEELSLIFDWWGWALHGYIYIDYDQDREFTPNLGENGIPNSGSELVSYSAYEGHNSLGATVDNGTGQVGNGNGAKVENGTNTLHPFTLPSDLETGNYRVRFITDWNSIDPCGGSSIGSMGGLIIDFTLRIVERPACTVTVVDGGANFVLNAPYTEEAIAGTGLNGEFSNTAENIPYGTELTLTINYAEGKKVTSVTWGTETLEALDGTYTQSSVYTFTVTGDGTLTINTEDVAYAYPTGTAAYTNYVATLSMSSDAWEDGFKLDIHSGEEASVYNDYTEYKIIVKDENEVEEEALLTFPVEAGETVEITIETVGTPKNQYLFVDWNKDGDFADNGELVYSSETATLSTESTSTFTAPANLLTGYYRARFEVDTDGTTPDALAETADGASATDFILYVENNDTTNFPTAVEEVENTIALYYANGAIHTNVEGEIQVYDLSGKLVRRAQHAPVAVDDLANGIYIVRVNGNTLKFVK